MPEPLTRLFLITPILTEASAAAPAIAAAVGAGDVACVLLRLASPDARSAKTLTRALGRPLQEAGAALLVEADPRLAAHADADGVHASGLGDELDAAIDSLKPERIVGCGGLGSRDDAMQAGERDIDYVMFGEPAPDGTVPDAAWTLERVGWWAEVFNVPCVGYAATLDEVEPLAAAGADFVALGAAVFEDARGPAAAVAEAAAALGRAAALIEATPR